MKKTTTTLNYCILALLFFGMSCSKKVEEPVIELVNSSKKTGATTSSLAISYNKDTTPSQSTIPTTTAKIALYSIGPLTVEAGDVVTAHFQQELIAPNDQAVMVGTYLIAASTPGATTGNIGTLSKPSTSNLDPTSEGTAEVITRTGSLQFTAAASNVHIIAVVYVASLAIPDSPPINVPAGPYGELVAVVERGVTVYSTNTYQPTLPYNSSLSTWYAPATPVVQYSSGALTVPAQTLVDVRYQIEGTSEKASKTTPTHRLGRSVLYGSSITATTGTELVRASQEGIPRHYEHHHTSAHVGGHYFNTASPTNNVFFNSIVYSKNVVSPDILRVEPPSYGHFVVEMRPYAGYFQQDITRNITSVTSTTGQILYTVGPINVQAGEIYEIRYVGVFAPTSLIPFTSKIIRGTSGATTGITVQPALWRKFDTEYYYSNAIHSTAEKIVTSANNQYYTVLVSVPSGGTLPVQDWGELEVVKR